MVLATGMTPVRKRVATFVVAVGGVLIVQRVVALSSEAPEPAQPPSEVRAAVGAPAARTARAAPAPVELRLGRLAVRASSAASAASTLNGQGGQGALFEIVAWAPPTPKPAAPEAAPKPVAPPFPYSYMGGLSDDGVRTAFFMKGERVLPVKAGDVVDAAYRVDEMTPQQMTVTYLPLNETMTVALEGVR